jgi:hypothetical protein
VSGFVKGRKGAMYVPVRHRGTMFACLFLQTFTCITICFVLSFSSRLALYNNPILLVPRSLFKTFSIAHYFSWKCVYHPASVHTSLNVLNPSTTNCFSYLSAHNIYVSALGLPGLSFARSFLVPPLHPRSWSYLLAL